MFNFRSRSNALLERCLPALLDDVKACRRIVEGEDGGPDLVYASHPLDRDHDDRMFSVDENSPSDYVDVLGELLMALAFGQDRTCKDREW